MLNRRPPGGPDDRGAVMFMVALLIGAMLASAALVIDLGNARQLARHSQGAVDAAALAGARDLPISASEAASGAPADTARNRAMVFLVQNVLSDAPPAVMPCGDGVATCTRSVGPYTLTVTTPYSLPLSGYAPYTLVRAEACRDADNLVASSFGGSSTRVCRSAVGSRRTSTGGYGLGLVALEPEDCRAMQFRGDSETVLSSNGAVIINSQCSSNALDASGTSWKLSAGFIGVVGRANLAPCAPPMNTNCTATIPVEGIEPVSDPYAGLPIPAVPGPPNRSCAGGTMEPGFYPAECRITATGTYVFRPGFYWFDDGFSFSGGSIVCQNAGNDQCEGGITFYVPGGSVTLNGNGRVKLPPPTSGPYAGISLLQPASNTSAMSINGTTDFAIGTIYAPGAAMQFSGNAGGGDIHVNVEGMVLGRTVDIGGKLRFNIDVPADGPTLDDVDTVGLER